jgi:hypothetical protein
MKNLPLYFKTRDDARRAAAQHGVVQSKIQKNAYATTTGQRWFFETV